MLVKKGSEGMKKILLLVLIIGIFTIFVACNALRVDTNVIFHDDSLEAIIRHEINMPEGIIKKSDLLLVETLDLSNKGIQDLRGIEELKNLRELNLRNNQLDQSTTELIGSLVLIEYLNLRETGITDIDFISNLPLLTYLNIHSNPVITIKPLANLHSLEQLIMRNVKIGDDIVFLQNLKRLNQLNVRNCNITDITVLTQLMDLDALQGKDSSIDIRDNPVMFLYSEASRLIPYWENISQREPQELNLSLLPPLFSHESGFYEDSFTLIIKPNSPSTTIYYTTDGSEPDPNNLNGSVYKIKQAYPDGLLEDRYYKTQLYLDPIIIKDRTLENNYLSEINTTYNNDFYRPIRLHTKGTVIRAKAYNSNGESTKTVTHTYFIGSSSKISSQLPVISIVTNENNLFDYYNGIYVPGSIYNDWKIENPDKASRGSSPANYLQRGKEWERPAHVTFFKSDGSIAFSQDMGIRIHGGYSRAYQRKSFRLYPRSIYDTKNTIEYDVFNGLIARGDGGHIIDEFNRLNLRNSGNNAHGTLYKDALIQELVSHLRLDTQGYRPAVHYINGEFWGMINIRERFDDYYFYSHYGVEREDIVMLENSTEVVLGNETDAKDFIQLRTYAEKNDLSIDSHYQHIASKIDIQNFINHYMVNIYFNNTDWPGNNIKIWRKRTDGIMDNTPYGHDGKWRYMVFDTDLGFSTPYRNTITSTARACTLFKNLLDNEQFKQQFINTFLDNINTSFGHARMAGMIDQMHEQIINALNDHTQRWNTQNFDGNDLKGFAKERNEYIYDFINKYFQLNGLSNLTVKTNSIGAGHVKLNTVDLNTNTPGIQNSNYWTGRYFNNIPVTLTAIPGPGYVFDAWEGDVTPMIRNDATINLTMTKDTLVIANFKEIDSDD